MRYLVAFCLMVLAAGARADKYQDAYFRSLDLNGDGYVSLSEAAGEEVVVSRFDRADRNRDGKLVSYAPAELLPDTWDLD